MYVDIARQLLGEHVPAARRSVRCVVFCAVTVVSKAIRRLVIFVDVLTKLSVIQTILYSSGLQLGVREDMLRDMLNRKICYRQTPWPLVRKRTIPTERPPLVSEI
jgi:hypothetical protein